MQSRSANRHLFIELMFCRLSRAERLSEKSGIRMGIRFVLDAALTLVHHTNPVHMLPRLPYIHVKSLVSCVSR